MIANNFGFQGGASGSEPTGVESVTGLNTNNTDPQNPIVGLSVGASITGAGTPASPLSVNSALFQPTLVSGTNIKTVNGATLLGSGNVAVQSQLISGTNIRQVNGSTLLSSGNLIVSGSINAITQPFTNTDVTLALVTANHNGSTSYGANNLNLFPFIPAKTFVCNQISVNVTTAVAGGLGRVLIYTDSAGKPNSQFYASTNIDCSTLGQKTLTTSLTLSVGTIYWFAWNQNNASINIRSISYNYSIQIALFSTTMGANGFNINPTTFGSEPSPISGITTSNYQQQNAPLFLIRSS